MDSQCDKSRAPLKIYCCNAECETSRRSSLQITSAIYGYVSLAIIARRPRVDRPAAWRLDPRT